MIKSLFVKYLSKYVDLVSVETIDALNVLKKKAVISNDKIIFIPNGVERDNNNASIIKKENVILNVARIGTVQKNTEFILDVISKVNMKDWKLYFLGEVEEGFHSEIDLFFLRNPSLRESVFFSWECKRQNYKK